MELEMRFTDKGIVDYRNTAGMMWLAADKLGDEIKSIEQEWRDAGLFTPAYTPTLKGVLGELFSLSWQKHKGVLRICYAEGPIEQNRLPLVAAPLSVRAVAYGEIPFLFKLVERSFFLLSDAIEELEI
jgi:hypothetical protein